MSEVAKTSVATPKVHPLTVIFHALEDAVKSSAARKKIIAALADLTDTDVPTALQVAPVKAAPLPLPAEEQAE
jgi:hypothetical protein